MEELFNRILGLSELYTRFNLINRIFGLSHVTLIVSLSESEYGSCIEEARRMIYSKTISSNHQLKSDCYIRHLPRELLELILLKFIVGIMFVEWMSNVSNPYPGVITYMKLYPQGMDICIHRFEIRDVSMEEYEQRSGHETIRPRSLHEHYTIFAEQLNCRYVLVDCLEKGRITTEEEEEAKHFGSR